MRAAILGLTLAFACQPALAVAQVTVKVPPPAGSVRAIDEIRESYRVRLGGLYVDPAAIVKEFGMDSNVFNKDGNAKNDFTATVTPLARLALPFARRALVKATTAADFVYYARYASERSIDPQGIVRAETYMRRITLFAEESFLNTRQVPNDEIDLRARHLANDLSGGAAFALTTRVSAEAAVRRSRTRFDGDALFLGQRLQDTLDSDTIARSLTGRYSHSSLSTLGIRFEDQTDRFVWSPVRDTDSCRVMGGLELRPRALINGSAWVGYRRFTPKASVLPAAAGLVSQLALSYTLLGATTFGVTYDRDYQFAFEAATPYFVQNDVDLQVRRALGGLLDVVGTVGHHRYAYQALLGGASALDVVAGRVDTTRSVGVNLGYRIKRTRAGFGASYTTRNSTERLLRHYDRLRIGITMTRDF